MRRSLFTICLLVIGTLAFGQTATPNPRPLTMDEYKKGKTFSIANLDEETYVKFENTFVLDRYEGRKPYFITGSDGLKKRIDLYKFVAREGLQELGLMVFYTSETGKKYQALVPNFTADAAVWETYFDDIDNINKVEKNFILKLSYVLSKELSFQHYKVINGGKVSKDESAKYGTAICFPGDELVTMSNGAKKQLKDVKSGDKIITVDPVTHQSSATVVKELTQHEPENYALTQLVLVAAKEQDAVNGLKINLSAKVVKATPNHPMLTKNGNSKIGDIGLGEQVLCLDEASGKYETYTVLQKNEHAEGTQKVYNIVAEKGSTLIVNGVMVLQK
ncbi:Hint domain-containing protein [Mucilaginibacter sp. HD30]